MLVHSCITFELHHGFHPCSIRALLLAESAAKKAIATIIVILKCQPTLLPVENRKEKEENDKTRKEGLNKLVCMCAAYKIHKNHRAA